MVKKKEAKEKVVLMFNTLLFLFGAYDSYTQDKITLFLILIVTALVNLSMMILSGDTKSKFNLFVFFLNALIAFLFARDYYLSGSHYIHFAWITAGIFYLAATVVIYRKQKSSSSNK